MVSRHRRNSGEDTIVVRVQAPRWAVWCIAVGTLLIGVAAVGLVCVLWR